MASLAEAERLALQALGRTELDAERAKARNERASAGRPRLEDIVADLPQW